MMMMGEWVDGMDWMAFSLSSCFYGSSWSLDDYTANIRTVACFSEEGEGGWRMRVLASVEVLMDGRDTPEHIVGTLGFVCDVASTFSSFLLA
jgi:hypothetical protein